MSGQKTEIAQELFAMQDLKYRDFQAKLCPNLDAASIIGVRTPLLRTYAKKLAKEGRDLEFLQELPHTYFEENQLHGFLISEMKDYERALCEMKRFLPYIDNWATCDQTSPRIFKKHTEELLGEIKEWLASDETYTVRFGIGMLMRYYLDEHFKEEYLLWVSDIRSSEYYVNMMIAWYFATALAKQYDAALPYLENKKLEVWIHNKTIQKAGESFRITKEQKVFLKALKQ